MLVPQTSFSAPPTPPGIVHEVLASASRHVTLALVHVPGPAHTIGAQPYYRITFNIGPSYGLKASGDGFEQALVFARHSLMVIPPGVEFTHHGNMPRASNRRIKPGRLATFRISRELFTESAMTLGLSCRHAELRHQIIAADEVLRCMAQALFVDLKAGNPDGALATEHTAAALVCRLLLREHKIQAVTVTSPIEKVRAHIDGKLSTALTLEQLADVAGMSLFHFCRVFRDNLGVTPHQYILARRMERAKRLLWTQSSMSMLEVALACGYGSSSHFAAQFKRHNAQTPLQWQRSH